MTRTKWSAAFAIAVIAIVGCGGSNDGPTGSNACVATTPSACPTSNAPTYANDVAPILQAKCADCHSPSGVEPNPSLVTYDDVSRDEATAFSQVRSCAMPPIDAPVALTDAERATLLTWFVCGAPND